MLLSCNRSCAYVVTATSIKFLYLQTITTFNVSWTQKARTLSKSAGLKNCQNTTSKLIIDRTKLIELLMPCFNIPSGVLRKKRPSRPRIQRFYTDCSPCWLDYLDWVSREWASRRENSRYCPPYTKSSSAVQLFYRICVSFEILFEAS